MANAFQGCGILWGLNDMTLASLTGFGAFTLLQSNEYSEEAEKEEIKDSSGVTKAVAYTDRKAKATLEFIPTAGTNVGTLSVTAWPSVGTTLTVTDALFVPMAVTWLVDGVSFTRSNTKALMARINLSRYLEGAIP